MVAKAEAGPGRELIREEDGFSFWEGTSLEHAGSTGVRKGAGAGGAGGDGDLETGQLGRPEAVGGKTEGRT